MCLVMFSTMFTNLMCYSRWQYNRTVWAACQWLPTTMTANILFRTCKCRHSKSVRFFFSFCLQWNMGEFCGSHWQCFAGSGCVFSCACSRKSLWSECPSEFSSSQIKRLISFSVQRDNTMAVPIAHTHVYIVMKTIHQTKRPVLDIHPWSCAESTFMNARTFQRSVHLRIKNLSLYY